MNGVAEPAAAASALVEAGLTRLAGGALELAGARAWNDLLDGVDRLATLLGARTGPAPEPPPTDADPARVGRLGADLVRSLLRPEYFESAGVEGARYRVRLPEQARADGLGELADRLESLGLCTDVSVEGDVVRLSLSVGGGDRPALTVRCAPDRLEMEVDLDAARGALSHMSALVARSPGAQRAAPGLRLEELAGALRLAFSAGAGRMEIEAVLAAPLRVAGRSESGAVRIDVGPSALAIEGAAAGALRARADVGPVRVRLPAATGGADEGEADEYELAGATAAMHVARGGRALELTGLSLRGSAAVARRGGAETGRVELLGAPLDVAIEPDEPGRFALAFGSALSLRVGAPEGETSVAVPAGSRLDMAQGRLLVRAGRLVLAGAGARAPVDVGAGSAVVRLAEPRPDEPHPVLRFYDSAPID